MTKNVYTTHFFKDDLYFDVNWTLFGIEMNTKYFVAKNHIQTYDYITIFV